MNPLVLNEAGTVLYVANTTSNSVSVVDTGTNAVLTTIAVGLDPASLAVRPTANELWVSNHVSDTVSIIDIAPGSPTENSVIDTIQALNADGVTEFDEPVGIAFTPSRRQGVRGALLAQPDRRDQSGDARHHRAH